MRALALVNQKGGCGKTTTAIQVASRLAAAGLRTVLVDCDPQGHATLGLGVPAPDRERSLAAVLARSGLDQDSVPLREVLVPVADRLSLVPTGVELAEMEPALTGVRGGEERLAEHLAGLVPDVDRVVIDAPPSLGMLTLNALQAADEVVVPVEPSLFSLHGLARLVELMQALAARSHHRARLRVFLNAFDGRTRFARRTLEDLRRTFAGEVLETTVRPSVLVREATARGLPVHAFAASAAVAQDYAALVAELERGAEVAPTIARTSGISLTRSDVLPDRVRLAGDFNGWVPDSGVILEVHDDGSWTKFHPLPPGCYEYKLVVDGTWVLDPLNPRRISNGDGFTNSVMEIRA